MLNTKQTILPNEIHVLIFADDDITDCCMSYPFFPAHTTFGQPAVENYFMTVDV